MGRSYSSPRFRLTNVCVFLFPLRPVVLVCTSRIALKCPASEYHSPAKRISEETCMSGRFPPNHGAGHRLADKQRFTPQGQSLAEPIIRLM